MEKKNLAKMKENHSALNIRMFGKFQIENEKWDAE